MVDGLSEVQVTNSFLSLEENVRKCENKYSYNDCLTKNYLNILKKTCKCIPFGIRLSKKVCKNSLWYIKNVLLITGTLVCYKWTVKLCETNKKWRLLQEM